MSTSRIPTAQVHFILARDAPVAVTFQRRSKKLIQIIKWNTDTDTFEQGQWFKGQIYEDRSDISPDGTKIIYFAEKITRATAADPDYTTHWTAVSKLPYLTALALWPNGYGPREWPYVKSNEIIAMNGGGIFLSDSKVLLNSKNLTPHPAHTPQGLVVHDLHVQSLRNKQDSHGWEHVQELKVEYIDGPYMQMYKERIASRLAVGPEWNQGLDPSIFKQSGRNVTRTIGISHKTCPVNRMILTRTTVKMNVHTFKVTDLNGTDFNIGKANCADWDQSGRLVYARDGKIFTGAVDSGRIEELEIADFNENKFEAIEAPEWAKCW